MKQIFKPIFAALLVSLFALSCVKEQFREAGLEEGEGWLMVNFGPQESIEVTTKATQNATSENSVRNIYVFLIDNNGKKL